MQEYVTLAEAARRVPTGSGKPVSIPTIWRWARKGVRGVRLEYVRAGRRILIRPDALDDFMRRLAEADDASTAPSASGVSTSPKPHSATRRAVELAEAEDRLRDKGVLE